jgi:hypothetical protein
MKKAVYNFVNKDELHSEWTMELLNKLYRYSYPKPDVCFEELQKRYKELSVGKYKYPTDFYYMPHKVVTTIVEDFMESHGIELHWKDDMEFLIDILFNKGGIREVYGVTDWSKEPLRHCVNVETLDKQIPQEYSDKVKDILKGYLDTYKFGSRDYNTFSFAGFMYSPNCNRETVKNAWKELMNRDIEIPDDDAWISEYDAADLEDETDEEIEEFEIMYPFGTEKNGSKGQSEQNEDESVNKEEND